ncbi:hypothetical protein IFM53868_09276 [Aspergillus udagawae]|uniref:Zn(2)-C6 fungal-type domain-containing protein n=1 Tax=Aspergillus udagawae TaxID=91492 RepID=A0ABQ1BB25_9EURO|nr:hypothetical protein IFM53868_09276 [Aspergillus udagawae]
MAILGPLDRRTARTRCAACARRRIKCEGGPPCRYCIKRKQQCVPQEIQPQASLVFVNVSAPSKRSHCLSPATSLPVLRLCPKVSEGSPTLFVKHFFSDFLARNDFGGPLDLGTVISEFQRSPSLYQASIALGALDLSKRPLLTMPLGRKDASVGALTAYHTSIAQLKDEIVSNRGPRDVNLWTTFFLGLFELMQDMTGEGWVKHFLYGTSKLLQLRGPEAHIAGPGRSFFLTVRVFESPASTLAGPLHLIAWLTQRRVWGLLKPGSKYPSMLLHNALLELADEGFVVRSALTDWYGNFRKWSADTGTPEHDPHSLLATTYFHAISIYLSGIFDYRPQFNEIPTPTIVQAVVQNHVDAILRMTEMALNTTNLAAVLFFFPLRVAGARVTTAGETKSIGAMLQEISTRGFAVADAFRADLKSLWHRKGI